MGLARIPIKIQFFLLLLTAVMALSGCYQTTRPASKVQYAPPFPVLEQEPGPYVRIPQADPDARLVSQHTPDRPQDRLQREGLRHPQAARNVKEVFFQDIPLEIAAELFNEVGGVNLIIQREVADERVRLYLKDVTMAQAVEGMLRRNELWFRTQGQVTSVMTEEAYADRILFNHSEKVQVFFMRYTNAQDMAALIGTILDPDVELLEVSGQSVYGHLETSLTGGSSEDADDTEVMTAEERRRLVQAGEAGDILEMEKAINLLGKRVPSVMTVFKKNNAIVVRSTDEAVLRHITGLIRELDTPVRQVLLETRIVRLELGDGFESFFDFSYQDSGSISNRRISRDGTYETFLSTLGGVSSLSVDTLSYVFSTDILQARLQVFAEEQRLNTISSPFLMAADNAEVRFFVGQQIPLRTGVTKETVPISDIGERVLFIPQVQQRELGTELQIKSFINADRTITMEIEADIQSPNLGVNSIILINDLTGQPVTFPLDGVDKNEVHSVLAVPSGNTVALAGFIRLEDQDFEQKVPFLGDIPVLGNLFKRVERRASRTETVILITPHIIGHPGEGTDATRSFLDRNSRIQEETDKAHGRVIPEDMRFDPLD
ncbi:type II secretion system protein GspD [Desulfonatronovibrio hydrogenovorans]|uniref:type II secretion system protein GspD n=1 Tax=Desulfonatronovibrio hydrogenovorans TaxID=53245 RepID=UPI00048E2C67|nr:hypothetical protein [Desulfonatronovibrio hydrogenovorans]